MTESMWGGVFMLTGIEIRLTNDWKMIEIRLKTIPFVLLMFFASCCCFKPILFYTNAVSTTINHLGMKHLGNTQITSTQTDKKNLLFQYINYNLNNQIILIPFLIKMLLNNQYNHLTITEIIYFNHTINIITRVTLVGWW